MSVSALSVYSADTGANGTPMSTKTTEKQKAKRESWETWLPAGAAVSDGLLTREDLISALHNIGVEVTADDFRNWQLAGVIPYGTLGWDEKTRATRSFYPRLMVTIIAELRKLQHEGYKLADIGPRLRSFAFYRSIDSEPFNPEENRDLRLGVETPVDDLLRLKPVLLEIARKHGKQTGRRVTRLEVRLDVDPAESDTRVSGLVVDVVDESGALLTYSWP